jgi:hypothetical protein
MLLAIGALAVFCLLFYVFGLQPLLFLAPRPLQARTNKPTLCLDKIQKCCSADWKRMEAENAENGDAYRGAFFFCFFFWKRKDSLIVRVNHAVRKYPIT